MSALSTIGQRQQLLLKAIQRSEVGLTADALAKELLISRNAVIQHIASLEGNGLIENSSLSSTGGRPSRLYTLTDRGQELFPRHYALFSNLLVSWIRQKLGDKKLKSGLIDLGKQIAREYQGRVDSHSTLTNKVSEVTNIMQELGYDASLGKKTGNTSEIVASNCVFHKLAEEYQDICQLDLSLMSTLLNADIEHKECMVRGGQCCRFKVSRNDKTK